MESVLRDLYTNKTPQTKKGGFKAAWRIKLWLSGYILVLKYFSKMFSWNEQKTHHLTQSSMHVPLHVSRF